MATSKTPKKRLTTSRTASAKKSASKKKLPLHRQRIFGLRAHHFGGIAVVLAAAAWMLVIVATRPAAPAMASSCGLTNKLVNSCRPLIGGAASYYPGTKGFKSDILDFENRAHRQMDVPHSYQRR
jgi:hypothetical protein